MFTLILIYSDGLIMDLGSDMEEYLEKLRKAILNFDVDGAREAAKEAMSAGVDPVKAIEEGLAPAIREVGDMFHRDEIFLPHVVMASDAMTAAIEVIEPHISKEDLERTKKGVAVIGTVEGDIHEIGKNVVTMMLKAAGFEVIDLGTNVSAEKFVEKAKDVGADIIACSSLMTTTMPYMKEVIEEVERQGLKGKIKVMVGGGPVTRDWAEEIGADGYGKDADEAVKVATELTEKKE